MVKSGGISIYPLEIESVIYSHPDILEAAVIGVPDRQWGEALKAVIVLKQGAKITEEELQGSCKERLSSYKVPKSVDFVSRCRTPKWEGKQDQGEGNVLHRGEAVGCGEGILFSDHIFSITSRAKLSSVACFDTPHGTMVGWPMPVAQVLLHFLPDFIRRAGESEPVHRLLPHQGIMLWPHMMVGVVVLAQPLYRLAVGFVVEFAAIIQPSQMCGSGTGDDAFDTFPCSLSVGADGARHSIDELHGRWRSVGLSREGANVFLSMALA